MFERLLHIEETRVTSRHGISGQASLPFAPGVLREADLESLRLLDDTAALPLQSHVLARWPTPASGETSIKWLLLDFLVDLAVRQRKTLRLVQDAGLPAPSEPSIHLQEDDQAIRVNTGVLSLSLPRHRAGLVTDIRCANQPVPVKAMRLVVTDGTGREHVSAAVGLKVSVERRGPLCCVVRLDGEHLATNGDRCTHFAIWLTFVAGQSVVRMRHAFINAESSASLHLRRVAIELIGADDAHGSYDGQLVTSGWMLAAGADFRLSCFNGEGKLLNKSIPRIGTQPVGYGHDGAGALITMPHFKEQYPKAFRVLEDRVAVELWPEGETLAYRRAMGKSHELLLSFYGGAVDRAAAASRLAQHQTQPRAWVDAEQLAQTGTVRGVFAAGRRWGAYPRFEQAVKDTFNNRDLHLGMLHFGDDVGRNYTNGGRGGYATDGPYAGRLQPIWNNFEYDFPFVALHQALRTGEDYYFEEGEIAIRHMLGVDYLHPHEGEPLVDGMLPQQAVHGIALHSVDHTESTGWSPCHTWIGGILYYHLLTGDIEVMQKATAIAHNLCWWVDSPPGRRPLEKPGRLSREYGWALIALSEFYEITYDPKVLDAMRRIVGFMREWESKSPLLCHSGFAVFICLTGLARHHQLTGDDVSRELFLKLIESARQHLFLPEGLLAISSSESRPGCYGRRWGHGIMGCEALAYAYQLTGDLEYIRTGVRELAYLLDSGVFRYYPTAACLFAGVLKDDCGHTVMRSEFYPVTTREIAQHLRHLFRFLEVAHELDMLHAVEYGDATDAHAGVATDTTLAPHPSARSGR